jgi:hypothetical protein
MYGDDWDFSSGTGAWRHRDLCVWKGSVDGRVRVDVDVDVDER